MQTYQEINRPPAAIGPAPPSALPPFLPPSLPPSIYPTNQATNKLNPARSTPPSALPTPQDGKHMRQNLHLHHQRPLLAPRPHHNALRLPLALPAQSARHDPETSVGVGVGVDAGSGTHTRSRRKQQRGGERSGGRSSAESRPGSRGNISSSSSSSSPYSPFPPPSPKIKSNPPSSVGTSSQSVASVAEGEIGEGTGAREGARGEWGAGGCESG